MDPSEIEQVTPVEATTEVPVQEQEPEPQQATEAQRLSNRERKQQNWRELKEAARLGEEARAQLEEERRERARLAEQVAELRGRTEAIQQQSRRAEPEPQDRVTSLRQRATDTLRAMNEAKDPEAQQRLLNQWYDLNDQIQDVRDEARWAQRREQIAQQMPRTPSADQRMLESEFPWLGSNEAATQVAMGIEKRLWKEGKPANVQTSRMAAAEAAKVMGLGGGSPPSEASRRKFALPSSREGANDAPGPRTMSLNEAQKKMAEAAYPGLEAPEAWSKWASTVGQRVLAKQNQR